MRLNLDFDFTALSTSDRIRLALALWESLEPSEVDAALPLTDAQAADLDRRVAAMDRDGSEGLPWDAVAERARASRGRR